MRSYKIYFACLFMGLLLCGGCAGREKASGQATDILLLEGTPTPAIIPTLTPLPSPLETPMPEPPTPTEGPMQTATPTPTDSPAPATPSPAAEESKTTVAEGFYYMPLDDSLKKRITGMSYPAKGEVRITYGDLRYIGLLHYDFEGQVHTGELIVHRKVAKEVTQLFQKLYEAKYPLASIRLVDDYGEPGDDNLSMAANNTSAFNYRRVTGSKTLSRHSYGAAIDINPLYNPYLDGERVAPPGAAEYVDRSREFPGKIDHSDLCYKLFTEAGWSWGGDFKRDKDYQHFSKDIGFSG